jgi:hypothetical protein
MVCLLGAGAPLLAQPGDCFVTLKAYDEYGHRQPLALRELVRLDERSRVRIPFTVRRVSSIEIRVFFPAQIIGQHLLGTLKIGERADRLHAFVPLDCGGAVSMVDELHPNNAHASVTEVSGRVDNRCPAIPLGSIWIVITPMFGAQLRPSWGRAVCGTRQARL